MMPPFAVHDDAELELNEAADFYDIENPGLGSTLIDGLNKAELGIDRKVLADLAVHDMPAFTAIAEKAKAALPAAAGQAA